MFFKCLSVAVLVLTGMMSVSAKELKVMMIGNSFSVCAGKYLPQVVNADKENKLILTSVYIGGCPLDKHHKLLLDAEKNPELTPYSITVWDSAKNPVKGKRYRSSLNKILQTQQFDIITIQQASPKSWKPETYEPHAGELIKYIRKYQKNAEIVIQQTWAYRIDSPRLKKWKIDQQTMYHKINDAYRKLAETYKLRVIPMGDAVQQFRKLTPVKYKPIDTKEVFKEPALPSFAGDVVGVSLWQSKRQNKKIRYVHHDYSHLNNQGHYLQALVWYAFLFNKPVASVKFVPKKISKADIMVIQKAAQNAIDGYKQAVK